MSMLAWARLCVLAGPPGDSATQCRGISGYGYSLGIRLHPSRRWYLGPAAESRL